MRLHDSLESYKRFSFKAATSGQQNLAQTSNARF
jgi:hypothetical protein